MGRPATAGRNRLCRDGILPERCNWSAIDTSLSRSLLFSAPKARPKGHDGVKVTRFHCLFGPSQLRRLGPKRPRNTSDNGALPRAALRLWRRLPWATMTAPLQGASAASRPGKRTRLAPPLASLALGWYVLRFQRFCRFAARETDTLGSA